MSKVKEALGEQRREGAEDELLALEFACLLVMLDLAAPGDPEAKIEQAIMRLRRMSGVAGVQQ